MPSEATLVLGLALLADVAVGDPVSRWHPVAIYGRMIEALLGRAPHRGRRTQLLFGTGVVAAGVGVLTIGVVFLLDSLQELSPLAAVIAGGFFLKASMSYRQLDRMASCAADAIESGDLTTARVSLRALVSRDTESLRPSLLASAAIESLAENLSDSLVAPLFYFVLFGVPGAVAYRAINTLDAMVGYHGRYEYLGRAAARVDDLANIIPSRLTAVLLVAGSACAAAHPRRTAAWALRDHALTESPNAGWPMAAMAGALEIQLEKVGHYRLGDPHRDRGPSAIRRGIVVARWTAGIGALVALVATMLVGGIGWQW